MKTERFLKELDRFDDNTKVMLHEYCGSGLAGVIINQKGFLVLADKQDIETENDFMATETVAQLKDAICSLAADDSKIMLHSASGPEVFYVLSSDKFQGIIWLEGEEDVNMKEEINAIFQNAVLNGEDELDVYSMMLEIGITPEHVSHYLDAEKGKHMETFCKSHGLL